MSSRCLEWKSGFIKFGWREEYQINWNVRDWALPISVTFKRKMNFYRFLCVSLIVEKRAEKYPNIRSFTFYRALKNRQEGKYRRKKPTK